MSFSVASVTYDALRLKYLINICNFISCVIDSFSISFSSKFNIFMIFATLNYEMFILQNHKNKVYKDLESNIEYIGDIH